VKFIFNKNKIIKRLGLLSIPLLSTPLLLPLVWAEPLPFSLPSVNLPMATSPKQPSEDAATSQQSHAQPSNQNEVVASPSAKSFNSKPTSETPQKTQVKQQKQPAATKTRTSKPKAKQQYTAPAIEIRVAIAKDTPELVIGSSNSAQILDTSGKVLQTVPSNQAFQAQTKGSALLLGNWQLPPAIWIRPTKGGYVYVGDRWYRGRVLLVSKDSKLLAVNYVDLEQYLYSVVGSEMHPTAPTEALKAQAIAARSYALVHLFRPASAWYNLGDNQRWQVYKGLEGEWNTSHQAVNSTAGQILSSQGGVVESLYAASDEIVLNAHGGAGMSQQGAYKLAAQGYNYGQILGAYYPGAELTRLELKR